MRLLLKDYKKAPLVCLSATLAFLGFCGFGHWYLAWFAFVPLLWAIDDASLSGWRVFGWGWFFGTVALLGGYHWLALMIRDFWDLNIFVACVILLVFAGFHAFMWATWVWLIHLFSVRRRIRFVWSVPVTLVVCEWLFPGLFPTYMGNSQYEQLLVIQSADLWGPLGLSFLLAMVSATLYEALATLRPGRPRYSVAGGLTCATLVAGNLVYGWLALERSDKNVESAEKKVRIGYVQTNAGFNGGEPKPNLERHHDLSRELEEQGADLIVWSETIIRKALTSKSQYIKKTVLGPLNTPLVFGAIRSERGKDRKRRFYNSAMFVDGSGKVLGSYDKNILLVFGEYLPFTSSFPSLYDLSPNTGRFTHGSSQMPVMLENVKYGVLICYEDILSGFVRRLMNNNPEVLLNLTDDGWFGETDEPRIHLALSVFRAVEQRRFLVRATNTGISTFIGPGGRIIKASSVGEEKSEIHEVAALQETTFYQRFGPWVAQVSLLVSLYWLVAHRSVRRRQPGRRVKK